jgi:hypothetical protein
MPGGERIPGDGCWPALIAFQIGGHERQAILRVLGANCATGNRLIGARA